MKYTHFANLKVPGPTKTPLTEPFWQAAAKGELHTQYCERCHSYVFYPREVCPFCWSNQLTWCQLSGQAKIKTYTTIWKPGHPSWAAVTPYTVGVIQLAEGPSMLALLLLEREQLEIGLPVSFKTINLGGQMMPAFTIPEDQYHDK
ncbi:Zn-ribbon domain-containing OB-fold protein [Marinomonas spartinae]|uniref:Zn-ribbon domain-containing OB-fold protein n=1 Tax=Marinomonas spartinae TaxID=1792290 RepID=UPI0018F17D5B|nr:OB-fold domain-containing protein [Marinomonas spartinae]MBJ7556481.1 OB-fold domain-containing protein [Marinomonas spartinae]